MHGTLILETHSARNAIPALLAALIVSAAAMAALARRIPLDGGRFAAAAAILTYVCFRLLYPLLSDLLPGGGREEADWETTRDVLVLDGEIIPRSHIRHVHVWPNRDALGHRLPGWTVNLEMTGGNTLLRSLTRGEDAASSADALAELVRALGGSIPSEAD